MKNSVGRDIPQSVLDKGYEPYGGKNARHGSYMQKVGPKTRRIEDINHTKLCATLREACERCGAHDGMTISFHHGFREGDYVTSLVCKVLVEEMGLKDLTVASTSLGAAQDLLAQYIEEGKIIGVQASGVRGRIGEVISAGKLKTPAIIRSHGGRPRALESGELKIDIAFVAASTADDYGNAKGTGGKNNCGSLGYAIPDSRYADHVVVITDTLVPFPNSPASVKAIDVDCVCVVDAIGDAKKIATKEARVTQNPRELMMAEKCADIIEATPWFVDGFSFQTGAGGPSLAVNRFLEDKLRQHDIKLGMALGGITAAMCDLQDKGLVRKVIDTQDFDTVAVSHLASHPDHCEISVSEYANPANKGAYVNRLDYVVLSALEVDTNFNVNVITGSDGVVRGAPGGHPDTAAGSKCCIIVTPLTRGRMATICEQVVTVTTPGDCVDVVVTDYGVAVNPARQDLIECLDKAGIEHTSIEALKEKAYSLVGRPDDLQWEDKVVAIVEARDGTVLDVIRKIKPLTLD